MKASKAFRKFGRACMDAPPGAQLTLGVSWVERKGWRVVMLVHTSSLHLDGTSARGLADIYDKNHAAPEWRGRTTGLEWVAPELRNLADEVDAKNARGDVPPEMLHLMTPEGRA